SGCNIETFLPARLLHKESRGPPPVTNQSSSNCLQDKVVNQDPSLDRDNSLFRYGLNTDEALKLPFCITLLSQKQTVPSSELVENSCAPTLQIL
ncbi:unnamed protein product, partial [Schistosoma mattheei]